MVAAVKTTAEWCWSLIPNKSWTFQSHKSGETGAAFRSRQMCNEAEQKNKELQINALIYTLGKEAEHIHVFNALTFKEGDEKKYNVALNKFEEHFVRKWNIIQEWACFHQCVQKDGETVEAFIENLYELTKHCEFGLQRDQQIRDRIVIGILDKSLSQKLQMKSDLNLDTAIKMAYQTEHVKVQVAGQVDTLERWIKRIRGWMQIEDKVLLSVATIFDNLVLHCFSHVLDATVLIGLTRHARWREPNVWKERRNKIISLSSPSQVGYIHYMYIRL